MKLKNMINNDTREIMKKLLYGLDYRTCYVVEYLHDSSVDVREVEVIRDKKTGKIIYYKDKEQWKEGELYVNNFTNVVIDVRLYYKFYH